MKAKIPIDLITDKYIKLQKHPSLDLYIYNYTHNAQFERMWNEWTLMCRGLVLDGDGNIVARPFGKFFNYEEPEADIPTDEKMEIFEKLDGSFAQVVKWNGHIVVTSRGSFTSEQAFVARNILVTKHTDFIQNIEEGKTYVFELIYPDNRIVIDYGNKEDLVLLTIVDNETGEESLDYDLGFEVVKRYDFDDITLDSLKQLDYENEEGFVIRFSPSNKRVKVKFETYVRLHKVATGLNEKGIWEILSDGGNINDMIEGMPDELYKWAKRVVTKYHQDFSRIEASAIEYYESVQASPHVQSRADYAAEFKDFSYPSILFSMLDEKPYKHIIWKLLRPKMSDTNVGIGNKITEGE